jgi:hypothetical protein
LREERKESKPEHKQESNEKAETSFFRQPATHPDRGIFISP